MSSSDYIVFRNERFNKARQTLVQLMEYVKNREVMVEVGSLAGFSTKIFAQYFDKVYSVDPYIPYYDEADMNSDPNRLLAAREAFEIRFCDEPNVIQIKHRSHEAAMMFDNNSIDFLYLDGGHTEAAVTADLQSWENKIKRGGFVGGDDMDWIGVRKSVNKFRKKYKNSNFFQTEGSGLSVH